MTNQFLGNETDIFFSEFSDLPESTPFTSYDAMPPHLPGILLFSRGNPMLFKANQSSLCQGGVDLGDEDDEMVLEVRMRKGDRDELTVSKDIRIGMVREMVFSPKSFQMSEVTWVVKIHGIRMILVTFHENRDTCVSVSIVILRHMLQNDGIEHYPPVCIRPPIGTPNIAPFQLDLRAQNYLPQYLL